MTPQKYPRGTRVEILSRRDTPERQKVWENSYVGCEAIILSVQDWEDNGYGDVDLNAPGYELLIFDRGGVDPSTCATFEERFLRLECSNIAKGEALIEKYKHCL